MELSEDDLKKLGEVLLENPQLGDRKNRWPRKMRIQIENHEKSVSGREIYFDGWVNTDFLQKHFFSFRLHMVKNGHFSGLTWGVTWYPLSMSVLLRPCLFLTIPDFLNFSPVFMDSTTGSKNSFMVSMVSPIVTGSIAFFIFYEGPPVGLPDHIVGEPILESSNFIH